MSAVYLLPLAVSCYIVDKYVKLTAEHLHNIQSQQPQTLASAPLPWYLDGICPLLPVIHDIVE